jgi:hypothetical protein
MSSRCAAAPVALGFTDGTALALVKSARSKAMKTKTNVKAGYIGETEKNLRR